MKKIGIMFVMVFLVFGMIPFLSAEEETELEIESAGVVPGQFFYGFDKMWDGIKYSFARGPEKKAGIGLRIAEERLAESGKLSEEGNFKRASKVNAQHEKYMLRVEGDLNKMRPSENVQNSENSLRSMAKIQERIESHQEKVNEMRLRILENHGEEMTEEELAEFEETFAEFELKAEKLENLAIQKKTNFEMAHKALSEMTDEELAALLEKIDSEEGLGLQKEMRSIREETRNQRELEVREQNLERAKERLENSNFTEEEKAQIRERIESQEQNFEQFKERKEFQNQMRKEKFENAEERRQEHQEELKEALQKEIEQRASSSEDEEDLANNEENSTD